ncbi:hypothetical protein C8R47DRAFT_1220363 [Mycena vitilis]|nr:hypothetical protein C8R47DRAFT_1220363 [Mycena vitilis]
MSTPPVVPAGLHVVELSGPLIVGYLLHWGLFGTLTIQLSFPKDRIANKALVYSIELVQTILISWDAFTIFGYGFLDLSAVTKMDFAWLSIPIMSGVAGDLTRLDNRLARRIRIVIETGSFTALLALINLVLFVALVPP